MQKNSNLFSKSDQNFDIINSFQQQFVVKLDDYRDNNNFLELDSINIKRDRFLFLEQGTF